MVENLVSYLRQHFSEFYLFPRLDRKVFEDIFSKEIKGFLKKKPGAAWEVFLPIVEYRYRVLNVKGIIKQREIPVEGTAYGIPIEFVSKYIVTSGKIDTYFVDKLLSLLFFKDLNSYIDRYGSPKRVEQVDDAILARTYPPYSMKTIAEDLVGVRLSKDIKSEAVARAYERARNDPLSKLVDKMISASNKALIKLSGGDEFTVRAVSAATSVSDMVDEMLKGIKEAQYDVLVMYIDKYLKETLGGLIVTPSMLKEAGIVKVALSAISRKISEEVLQKVLEKVRERILFEETGKLYLLPVYIIAKKKNGGVEYSIYSNRGEKDKTLKILAELPATAILLNMISPDLTYPP